ncbi:MAG TPA: 23S rRNA (adenine(2503)-C(2))-methyltransferase RlmN [Desulfonatronum sp.]|nr:23S rRNA (adenine(2503)-C(2))-methyltransferase RlmN [Desulfonatronum sp.]
MKNLLDLTLTELERFCDVLGEPPFRALQIWQWLWQKHARDFATMTNVSKELRQRLARIAVIAWPEVVRTQTSSDGTIKFLLALVDNQRIETVLIPEKDHYTQCLSSQVGCALGCTFCATGQMGLARNLGLAEILGQILVAQKYLAGSGSDLKLRNLVFMGMGEPLLNWTNVRRALESLHHPLGMNFSRRRITLSTVGLPHVLHELGTSGLASLAVSLHAPNQELRARIMPKAARYPLDELIRDLETYPLQPRRKITIEYVLLGGVNDSLSHARDLVRLLNKIKVKINLIPFHPSPELPYDAPDMGRVLDFEALLKTKGLPATLRKSKGQDIVAACGQLLVQSRTQAF